MILVRKVLLWGALQFGYLVVGEDFVPGISRVFLNSTLDPLSIASSTTSSETPSTSIGFGPGGPNHGPTKPSTLLSATHIVTVIGGHTVTDGTYVDGMGDTVTVTTSFSLSPVGVSPGIPTQTESSLPWTGRVLTDPGILQTSRIVVSTGPNSSLVSTSIPSSSSVASNSSSSKWANTTSSSTSQLTIPTSPVVIGTPWNITLVTATTAFVSPNGSHPTGSATYSLFQNVSTCSTLTPGEPVTIWSIMPNTTTTTVTITSNLSTSLTPLPEFTPPVYCPTASLPPSNASKSTVSGALSNSTSISMFIIPPRPTSQTTVTLTDSLGISSTIVYIPGYTSAEMYSSNAPNRVTVTSITTSKNGVTQLTSVTVPSYGVGKTDKATVDPTTVPPDSFQWIPQTEPPRTTPTPTFVPTPITTIFAGDPAATTPLTEVVGGVTVVAAPSKVAIGGQTVVVGPTPQTVTEGGQVFTVLPNEVVGPSVIISLPTYTSGGVFVQKPTPTTVNGVSIGLGAGGGSSVVIGGTSFNIGPDAPPQTIVDKGSGQTITVGSGGVAFGSTTITPPPSPAAAATSTNIAIVGGSIITAVGSSVAIIGTQTFTYGPNTPQTTTIFNGEPITIGPSGIIFHGSTIGGTALNPSSSQIGIVGGVSITEIGSTLAIISGTTFTIGPNATPVFATIASQLVSAGPDGLSDGSFSWNPFPSATHTLTAGSITFSELGSSLVVIGSKTFTFGPGAIPTTDVYGGQTISIGPNGIGFPTTTFTSVPVGTGTGTAPGAAKTTSKKNAGMGKIVPGLGLGVWGWGWGWGVWGMCFLVGVGWIL